MKINQQEQLFIELNNQEGASISGGATFLLQNSFPDKSIGFEIRGVNVVDVPGNLDILLPVTSFKANSLLATETKSITISGSRAQVRFDTKEGPEVSITSKVITSTPALWTFSRSGDKVVLGSIATLKTT